MKVYLDCYPCVLRHTVEVSRMVTDDVNVQYNVLNSVLNMLGTLSPELTPPEITTLVHRIIKEKVNNNDPYKSIKEHFNKIALSMYDELKKRIEKSDDSLLTAVKIAIAGNIIDYGASNRGFEVQKTINETLATDLAINDYEQFMDNLKNASSLLYIGDNAGEIVFDRLLIEELQKLSKADMYFMVRGNPILNDATATDARETGLDEIVRVISDGNDSPAFVYKEVSDEAKRLFDISDMKIAKGQGNYEAISGRNTDVYCLLRLKCILVAKDIGGNVGDNVLKKL